MTEPSPTASVAMGESAMAAEATSDDEEEDKASVSSSESEEENENIHTEIISEFMMNKITFQSLTSNITYFIVFIAFLFNNWRAQ